MSTLRVTVARYATFHVDDLLLAIEVGRIQEVLSTQLIVPVPRAPAGIIGLVNLRGQIVAAVEARQRLGLPERDPAAACVHVIIHTESGLVSLVVDREGDLVTASITDGMQDPVTVDERIRRLVKRVHPMEDRLLLVLDVDRTVQEDVEERWSSHAGSRD